VLNKKVEVDLDNDGKSDIKIDVKFLGLLIGGIISLTMTYSQLTSEIEIAKELPKHEKINIESLTQKIDFLEKQVERLEDQHDKRLEGLEEKVYKR
jgi:cell division protein FtsB